MNMTITLAAVGDSVTEGVGDPARGGLHGWVRYLAEDAGCRLVVNLARAGARVADVRRLQLERAVAVAPDVVTCAIGVNDVLRPAFDAGEFAADYDHVIGVLAAAATRGVLTMTLHDVAAGLPLRAAARARLRERTAQANAVIEEVASRHGAWLLDVRAAPALRSAGMLSVDLLHPNRRGHRFIASSAADVLRENGVLPPGPPAAVPEADPLPVRLAASGRHLLWVGRHVVAAGRRSLAHRGSAAPRSGVARVINLRKQGACKS
jgi:lysophospholipase L1-like esterase